MIVMPRPRRGGGIIKWALMSVRLSVTCLDLTRKRKGLGSPKLVGWKSITRVTREHI